MKKLAGDYDILWPGIMSFGGRELRPDWPVCVAICISKNKFAEMIY